MEAREIERNLAYCTGDDTFYRHSLRNTLYTSGINEMADMCDAYWLVDVIASHNTYKFQTDNPFQVWMLKASPTRKNPDRFVLTCEDGNYNVIKKQTIKFSDFPLAEMKIYYEYGTMMLPQER